MTEEPPLEYVDAVRQGDRFGVDPLAYSRVAEAMEARKTLLENGYPEDGLAPEPYVEQVPVTEGLTFGPAKGVRRVKTDRSSRSPW